MKPLFSFLLTLALLCSFASTPTTAEIAAADTTYVYICTGSSSTKIPQDGLMPWVEQLQGENNQSIPDRRRGGVSPLPLQNLQTVKSRQVLRLAKRVHSYVRSVVINKL